MGRTSPRPTAFKQMCGRVTAAAGKDYEAGPHFQSLYYCY
jgi:hypothetical protein